MIAWLLGGELGPAGRLVFAAPQWVVAAAAAAALLAFAASLPGRRPTWARVVEGVLWALALAGVVVAAARPVWLEEEGRREPGRVAVLVDGSRSMGTIEGGVARSAEALAIVDRLRGDDVDVYTFGGDLLVGVPSAFDLPATDVEGALDALRDRVAGERLAGVVLVTDGIDRGLLRRRFRDEGPGALPPELPGPLTIYGVGDGEGLRDLSVRSVDSGGFAFLRSEFTLTAEILGVGFEGRSLNATLLRDGAPVTEVPVMLDAQGRGEARFTVRPDRAGRFSYAVQVPVFEGDAVPANNGLPVVVRVVRDRIRVLQVAGHPSWDVKFLRRFLKGDPSVDLVSFFILRTQEDITHQYEDRELSLIEFPYEKLFTTDLRDFDLVVLQNFDPEPYFKRQSDFLLGELQRYVAEDGHALVMVGGDRSFDLGGYVGTPIEGILPLRMGAPGAKVSEDRFRPVLTEEGARHPITRLVGDLDENATWWERLHEMDGTNVLAGAHPEATVLLEHPTLRAADGAPLPVLAVREAGRGRTMALTVDASWRWSFSEAAAGRGNQAYLRFWKNAFRWLMADIGTQRVTVDTPRENYTVGDTVRVVSRVRDPGFAPLPDAEVTVRLTRDGRVTEHVGRTDRDGEWVLELPAEHRGAHRVEAGVTGVDHEPAETVFAVTARDPELDELLPDAAFLEWLAARTGGTWNPPGAFAPPARDPEAGRTVWDRRETPLWRAPGLLGGVLLLAGLAWWVRRRGGAR